MKSTTEIQKVSEMTWTGDFKGYKMCMTNALWRQSHMKIRMI